MKVKIIGKYEKKSSIKLPLYETGVSAGFPSPAEDYVDRGLDLNEHLITHPEATFFVRVEGESMVNAGINSGDILIVDRAMEPNNKKIVIAVVDGEFTVKRFIKEDSKILLVPENPDYTAIDICSGSELEIWGVVTYVIHKL